VQQLKKDRRSYRASRKILLDLRLYSDSSVIVAGTNLRKGTQTAKAVSDTLVV